KNWMEYSKKGEISDLEILLLLAFSADGKALPIPFSQFYRDDDKKESYNQGCRENYWNKLLHLVFEQGDEDKKLYQDKIMLKKIKKEAIPQEDYLAFKKTCLLYDWIKGDKDIKTIEQENGLYGGAIQVLGEGFSWLADSLMEIAENEGWRKGREEDLNKIKILSKRLIDGVEEEGLSLSRMHIPGNRIQERIKEEKDIQEDKTQKLIVETENPNSNLKPKNLKPKTVLEISLHRPDRIIFMGEKVEVTSTEFSLIHLLAKNRGKILTHNDLLDTLWTENEYSTYVQITSHLYKIRRAILKTIGNNKKNKKRVKDILKVVSRRGVMLNLEENKLKIS
ncbi:hypothetical protein CVT91_15275, partial [Candidatus Atribacteria bacterium HGW-Atribacteria-1]